MRICRNGLDDIKDCQIDVFFYGLFMDEDVLRDSGVTPVEPRRAVLEDFALRIGGRATLIPSQGEHVFGMVVSVAHREIERLYSGPGLDKYLPEAVIVKTLEDEDVAALCYNLPGAPLSGKRNSEYAARLQAVLRKLNFPAEYVESIQ